MNGPPGEMAAEKLVTPDGFHRGCDVDPIQTSLDGGLPPSTIELAAIGRIDERVGPWARPRRDSRPASPGTLLALEQDFADMERRPGGGGAGALAWLLAVLTAGALLEIIVSVTYYAREGWRW